MEELKPCGFSNFDLCRKCYTEKFPWLNEETETPSYQS